MSPNSLVLTAAVCVAGGATVGLLLKSLLSSPSSQCKLPPGPPGIPLLGNIFDLPKKFPWLKLMKWKEQYGPIFSLNMAGQTLIVLNTHKIATDLFDRRAAIYSDRPVLTTARELLTQDLALVLNDATSTWRKTRRAAMEEFTPSVSKRYQPLQFKEAALNLLKMLDQPSDWVSHIRHTTASGALAAIYGWTDPGPEKTCAIQHFRKIVMELASSMIPGRFIIDLFPFMKFLPSAVVPGKRFALSWHEEQTEFFSGLSQSVHQKTVGVYDLVPTTLLTDKQLNGDTAPCFVRSLEEKQARHGISSKEAVWLAGELCGGGTLTTAAALEYFILAMTLHPDVAHRAQVELDIVVGQSRLPRFEDRDQLPYIRAMLKETMRWRAVGPLGIPRRANQDDYYEGYLIPKGAIVMANVWGMNQDPDVFEEYDQFRPERYLDESGTAEIVPKNTHGQGHVAYGFGRRICPGQHFANQVLFIQMAMLLWAFDFQPPCDRDGKPILPDRHAVIDRGAAVVPAPFNVNIKPRFPDVAAVVAREVEAFD